MASPVVSELYDPATGAFSPTGSMLNPEMLNPESDHGAILLLDGRVLMIGSGSVELYDPNTGAFAQTTAEWHGIGGGQSRTLLSDGRVLLAGGSEGSPGDTPALSSAQIYTP
jgi:hypothetical protein